jgi:DNA polymerase-3 subunit epsilon
VTSIDPRRARDTSLPEFPLFELEDNAETPSSSAAAALAGPPTVDAQPARAPQAVQEQARHEAPVPLDSAPSMVFDGADDAPPPLMEVEVAQIVVEAEEALQGAAALLPEWVGAVGVFDLETTGIDTDTARIVSASVAVLDDCGVVVERKDWLVDPGVEIPPGAAAVHGITTDRARRYGRPAAEVVDEILAAIRSIERRALPLVIYNAPYDLTLLAREAARHGLEPLDGHGHVIDPLVLDKALDRYRKGKRTLEVTASVYGVQLIDAHDAAADAIAAGRVAQAMAARYAAELNVELARLHAMQVEWCREQAASFEQYMRRTRDPEFTTSGLWPCR